MERAKRVTLLPANESNEALTPPPNPARDVQKFVGEVMLVVTKPAEIANLGLAKATNWLANALPSFPAARLFIDLVLGWPHSHPHPPSFGFPLPSIGPVICAGAVNVLINGLPAVRSGDVGFGVWCGGYYPLFEVFTGSSNVFIGGARASRQLIDFTKHCLPGLPGRKGVEAAKKGFKGLSKLDKAMMALPVAMGALGGAAALADHIGYQEMADSAESESDAKEAAAKSEAAGIEAAMAGLQMAADIAAMALSVGMGKDPGITPFTCWGNFITGSQNVLIGGLPMPGWDAVLRGLGKLLKRAARRIQLKLPPGSRLRQGLCRVTGHPVDIASGRVFTSQTDFQLSGRIPIRFSRTYDSSSIDYEGPLGRGWMHPYDIHLWEDDGQGMVVLRNEEGLVAGFDPIGVGEKSFNPLEKQWLERLDDKVYVVCGKDWVRYKFAPIKEPGTAIEIVDDLDGKSEATALRLSEIEDRNGNRISLYYEDGHISWLEDGVGTRVNFSYITLDNGTVRLAGANQTLDGNSGRTARLVNFTYDSEGRLTNATDRGLVPWRYAYDNDLLIRETNRNGLSFHFEYRGEGREARCVHTWGDGGIYERWLDYDREARMTVVENSLGVRTSCYFNELYLPLRIVDALGGEEQFSYGSNGELLSKTDQIGRETKYLYNAQFDCISVISPDGAFRRFDYNNDSQLEKLTDETGAEFRFKYDDRGNISATIDPLGQRSEYSYNRFGCLEGAVDALGGVREFKWNERGHIIEFTAPSRAINNYVYDERGRLVKAINPLGQATNYVYDGLDRLVQVELPDGTKCHYEYDPEGNLTKFVDANGAETLYRYVDYNKLGERIDALGSKRRFVYDTEANFVEVRNEHGKAYRFVYDVLNRVIREIGFDGLACEYNYDPADQLMARIDPTGRITRFVYDLRGRVVERHRPDGTAINFSYDSVGRLKEANAQASRLIFKYDVLGRLVEESQNGEIIKHEYDALGRRIRRHSPSGQTVNFAYGADSRMSRVETPHGSVEFEYDLAGREIKRQLPGGLEESFYYDRCGRVIEQSLYKSAGALFHRKYKYDAKGSLIELSDSNKGVSSFVYDPVERLREVLLPEKKVEQFVYDSTGNLLRRGEREFHYDQPDRLSQVDGATLTYDDFGNLIEKRRAGSVVRYSYDIDNRLVAVESQVGGRVEFTYDALGRRTAKNSKNGKTGFLWDGSVLLAEQSEAEYREYVFSGGGYKPLCRFNEEGFQSYHTDTLGTPQELVDEVEGIVWSARYDVYGQVRDLPISTKQSHLRFPGQYEDVETGLFYNFHRYYDPDTGRYITKDPVGLAGGINPYGYTNNPVDWADPLGLVPEYYDLEYVSDPNTGDQVGRARGAFAEITPSDLRPTGTSPPTRDPSGWQGGRHPYHQQRSHLIADSLGGSGSDLRNLITLTDGSNNPGMANVEKTIRDHVRAGNTVLYEVRVNYDGDSLVPRSVHMYAIDQHGRVIVDEVVQNGRAQNRTACPHC
jgi:RHS repeat-associated protein